MFAYDLQGGLEELGCGADDMTALHVAVTAAEVGQQSPGFLYQENAGSDVPGLEEHLPEGIETAGGQIGQIQGGHPQPADARGPFGENPQAVQVGFHVIGGGLAEGYAGGHQGAFHSDLAADPDAPVVEKRAAAAAGGEFFLFHRIHDHCVFGAAPEVAADGDGVVGNARDEVGGAIQRVDNPQVLAVRVADIAGFLPQDTVVGVSLVEVVDNLLLGFVVHIGDEIVAALLVDVDQIHAFRRAYDLLAGTARRTQGDIHHGFHKELVSGG